MYGQDGSEEDADEARREKLEPQAEPPQFVVGGVDDPRCQDEKGEN